MQGKMLEQIKPDKAMINETIANGADETGYYFKMAEFRRAAFHVYVTSSDGIPDGGDVIVTIKEAKTAAGGDAQDLVEDIEIEGLKNAIVAETDLAATAAIEVDDTIEIETSDGLSATFTRKAATDTDEGEFANAAGLVDCIEAAGLGLSASAAVNVVTISVTERGSKTFSMTETSGAGSAWVPAGVTTEASAIVEVYAPSMSAGFQYLAVDVENDSGNAIVASADIWRGLPISSPVRQEVSAQA